MTTTTTTTRYASKKTRSLLLMAAPGILFLFVFNYLPLPGLVLAFKDYRFDLGLFNSPSIGFKNFEFFFKSTFAGMVTVNTLGYNSVFILSTIASSLTVAILLGEILKPGWIKFYQTVFFFPYFLSWPVVAFMTFALFNMDLGVLNRMLVQFGGKAIDWYSTPWVWRLIMPILHLWKSIGYNTLLIYAAVISIDKSLYESAMLDGASKLQRAFKITIPMLRPVIVVLTLVMLGRVFYSDFGQFYMIPRQSGLLMETTEVIDTYVFRALRVTGDIGLAAAVGLYQSLMGFLVVLGSNWLIRRYDQDNALF